MTIYTSYYSPLQNECLSKLGRLDLVMKNDSKIQKWYNTDYPKKIQMTGKSFALPCFRSIKPIMPAINPIMMAIANRNKTIPNASLSGSSTGIVMTKNHKMHSMMVRTMHLLLGSGFFIGRIVTICFHT